jgi:hypothetical protein
MYMLSFTGSMLIRLETFKWVNEVNNARAKV